MLLFRGPLKRFSARHSVAQMQLSHELMFRVLDEAHVEGHTIIAPDCILVNLQNDLDKPKTDSSTKTDSHPERPHAK